VSLTSRRFLSSSIELGLTSLSLLSFLFRPLRSDHYKKSGLAPAVHRVKMCELAVESTSTWLMVDPWEAGQGSYQRTAVVLQHFEEELNGAGKGVRGKDGEFQFFFLLTKDARASSRGEAHASCFVLVRVSFGRTGQVRKIKIMLLAGGDLIESFGEPGIWAEPDVSLSSPPSPRRTHHSTLLSAFFPAASRHSRKLRMLDC